jgi:hypothetical protein
MLKEIHLAGSVRTPFGSFCSALTDVSPVELGKAGGGAVRPEAGGRQRTPRGEQRLNVNIFHTSPTAIRMLRKNRSGRVKQVRLPLQAHDHRGRADRAGRVEMLLQRGWQARGGHRRYLVANRKRGLSVQYQAGAKSHEARQRRARGAGDLSRDFGRRRKRGSARLWPGRKHLHSQAVAGNFPNYLERSAAVR